MDTSSNFTSTSQPLYSTASKQFITFKFQLIISKCSVIIMVNAVSTVNKISVHDNSEIPYMNLVMYHTKC